MNVPAIRTNFGGLVPIHEIVPEMISMLQENGVVVVDRERATFCLAAYMIAVITSEPLED